MLRITIEKSPRGTAVRVEGRLTGPWVHELERSWRTIAAEAGDTRVCVDLTDVTFVGEDGKKLLETMYAEGAKLKASGCATRRLIEEIGQSFSRATSRHPVPTAE
jgi:anti-anti-sigma regulatory factor